MKGALWTIRKRNSTWKQAHAGEWRNCYWSSMTEVLSPAPTGVDTYKTTVQIAVCHKYLLTDQAGAYQPPFPGLERRNHGRLDQETDI